MRGQRRLFKGGEQGATSVEFAVLLTLLALALIAGVAAYGLQLGPVYSSAASDIEQVGNGAVAGGPQPGGPPGNGCENGKPPWCP